jgi:hypothetical protein
LFYQHRVDPDVPIETLRSSEELVSKARSSIFGLLKPGADDPSRLQGAASPAGKYSLWWREPTEVIPTLELDRIRSV